MPDAIEPGFRTDAELDALVARYAEAGGPQTRTIAGHLKHLPRWESWCHAQGVDPLAGTGELVARYVAESFDGVQRSTIRIYLRAVSWLHTEAGLPDPTTGLLVERAIDNKIRTAAKRPRVRRSTASKPLPKHLVRGVLGASSPPPSARVELVRARVVLGWWLDLELLPRLADLDRSAIVVADDRLAIGSMVLDRTGTRTCPVAAWEALCKAGLPAGDSGVFAGLHVDDAGRWRLDRAADIDKLHIAAVRAAYGRLVGRPWIQLRDAVASRRPSRDLLDEEMLDRLVVVLDETLWGWWRDDAILAMQFWLGLGSVDLCRLLWDHVTLDAETVSLSLPWRRHQRRRSPHLVSVSMLSSVPELCPVGSMRRWRWLTAPCLRGNDPVIPQSGRTRITAYDPDRTDATAALSAPLKRRLELLGVDPDRYSSTTGAKTLVDLACEGGATVFDVSAHLGRLNPPYAQFDDRADGQGGAAPADLSWEVRSDGR